MSWNDAKQIAKKDFNKQSLSCIVNILQSWVVFLIFSDDSSNKIEGLLTGIHPSLDFALIEAKVIFEQSNLFTLNLTSSSIEDQALISCVTTSDNLHKSLDQIAEALMFVINNAIEDGLWINKDDCANSHQLRY